MKVQFPDTVKTQNDKFSFLQENKSNLIYESKTVMKKADGIFVPTVNITGFKNHSKKFINKQNENLTSLRKRLIINTTYIMDSHDDVHIDNIWNKSVKENKNAKHIQEHKMSFDKIISDGEDLKVYVQTYKFRDLGYDADGDTQALVFDSNIKQDRNSFMFDEYLKGRVNNHSVGMFYVDLALAINCDGTEFKEEYDIYSKHISRIANKDYVEEKGYFWAIYEAKFIEGSAVPLGSNFLTPTLEPKQFTQEEEISAASKARLQAYKNLFIN